MRVLRFEMTRAFRNKWLAVSVALGTLIGLADIWLNVSQYGFNRGRALIQTWIGTDYQFAYNSLFYVLLPLIACFPYAGSCYQDQKTGYESSICIKTSRLSYMIAKEAAVAASGAAAVACPLLIAMFIAAGIYPDKRPEKLDIFVCRNYRLPHVPENICRASCVLCAAVYAARCSVWRE